MIHPRLKMTPFVWPLKMSGNFKFGVLPRMSYPDQHVWCPMLQYPLYIVMIAINGNKNILIAFIIQGKTRGVAIVL